MMGHASINTFGNYTPLRAFNAPSFTEPESWRIALYERLGSRLQNTFTESSQAEFIPDISDIVRNSINAATIESSLLVLQYYLDFRFPNPGEVIDYLQKHRNLYDVTLFACILTEEKFGSNAQISLELYKDPEIDDQYLTIFVRQQEYDSDIIDKIDEISREFEPALTGIDGYLLVNTDFQPPSV
jgi:hypothetical protein